MGTNGPAPFSNGKCELCLANGFGNRKSTCDVWAITEREETLELCELHLGQFLESEEIRAAMGKEEVVLRFRSHSLDLRRRLK